MTDFYSQNRCVCSTRSHGPLLCAFCLSFHFKQDAIFLAWKHAARLEDVIDRAICKLYSYTRCNACKTFASCS